MPLPTLSIVYISVSWIYEHVRMVLLIAEEPVGLRIRIQSQREDEMMGFDPLLSQKLEIPGNVRPQGISPP